MATIDRTKSAPSAASRRDLVLSWVSVALMAPVFVGTFVFGEWGIEKDAPWFVVPLGILLFAAFAAAAAWFGVRASKAGRRAGLVPAIIGGVAGGYMVVINRIGLIVRLVTGQPLGG